MLSKRSFDLSTDQGETASVEHFFVAGHLQNTVSLGNERGERQTTNVSSCSFRLMLGEERQRPQVSKGVTCFAGEAYPNSVQRHSSVSFHLMGNYLDKYP